MSITQTATATSTFTITHARYLSSKVKTDLRLVQIFYPGSISDQQIDDYGEEVAQYVNAGYLNKVRFGFKRNGVWIPPTFDYTAAQISGTNNDPGSVRAGCDVKGAHFTSYLWKNEAFWAQPKHVRDAFQASLPVQRATAEEDPVRGTWTSDNTYSAAGRALQRSTLS